MNEINFGCFCLEGGRGYQEDRVVANFSFVQSNTNKRICFFGIFDGHGGQLVSEFLAETFFSKLLSHKKIEFQPLLALQEVWQSFDEYCYSECLRVLKANNLPSLPVAGSTATICFISDNDVFILNCGDSAAYSVMQDGTATICTEDHGTLNLSEIERCSKAGGYLKNQTIMTGGSFPHCCTMQEVIIGKARIYPGGLLVTRAFGDFHAKKEQLGGLKGVVIHDHGAVKYIQRNSNIASIGDSQIKDPSKSLKYLVLASDGVWDVLSIDEVMNVIKSCAHQEDSTSLAEDTRTVSTADGRMKSSAVVTPEEDTRRDLQVLLEKGFIKSKQQSDFDYLLVCTAKAICQKAVNSPKWKQLGSSADNTSCTVVVFK